MGISYSTLPHTFTNIITIIHIHTYAHTNLTLEYTLFYTILLYLIYIFFGNGGEGGRIVIVSEPKYLLILEGWDRRTLHFPKNNRSI
jgi:hypothetical protein